MKPNEEIMEFLKENPTFYLATVDGYLPRVRPIGFAMWYNGHLCIALGKHKAAYKQLLDNTNLEICATNDRGEWLRVQGTANFDNKPTLTTRPRRRPPRFRSCPSWLTCTTRRPAISLASSIWIICPPSFSPCPAL